MAIQKEEKNKVTGSSSRSGNLQGNQISGDLWYATEDVQVICDKPPSFISVKYIIRCQQF